ncbi:MAG TPA: hypothetical protein VHC94_05390 [Nitrobacter sp.]|nr:hypothetical protein [Nitrobacter sp.]
MFLFSVELPQSAHQGNGDGIVQHDVIIHFFHISPSLWANFPVRRPPEEAGDSAAHANLARKANETRDMHARRLCRTAHTMTPAPWAGIFSPSAMFADSAFC